MKAAKTTSALDGLLDPLGECLTPETARRLVALKADASLQARVTYLADRHSEGLLTSAERSEYSSYVSFSTFVAILQSKARRLLAKSRGE